MKIKTLHLILLLSLLRSYSQSNSYCDKAIEMLNKNKMDSCDYYLDKAGFYSGNYVNDKSDCFIPYNTAKEKKFLADLEKDPKDGNAAGSVAIADFWLKKYDQSVKYYKIAINLDPKTKWYYTNLSYLYSSKLNDPAKAEEINELFLTNNPESDNYTEAAAKCFENKNYKKAITYFKKALVGNAIDHKAYNNIGLSFYFNNNVDSAIFYSRKATALNPEYYSAWENLYQCYYDKGDVKDFVECYGQALRLNETKTVVKNYDVKHDYDAMKEIVQNPTAKNYYELGDVLFNRKEYNRAKGIYEHALKIDPNYGKALFQVGLIDLEYSKEPNTEKAIGYFKKASLVLKTQTELCAVYENIGLCYEKKKDNTNALVNYKKALTYDANAKSVCYKLARVYEAMGDMKNANYYKMRS